MANISDVLSDIAITRSLILQRVSNGLSRQVADVYTDIIDEIVDSIKTARPVTLRNMETTIKELKKRVTPDINFIFDDLEELAVTESAFAISSTNKAVGAVVFSKIPPEATIRNIMNVTLLSDGKRADTLDKWFGGVDKRMESDLEGAIKLSVTNGRNNAEIAQNVNDIMGVNVNHAKSWTRTAVSMISNEANDAVWDANSDVIRGKEANAVIDFLTSFGCAVRDTALYSLDLKPLNEKAKLHPYEPAPRHPNCRLKYTVVLKTFKELGIPIEEIDVGTRSSLDGQIRADIPFTKWFESKTKAQQEKYLGISRYKLYKDGKINFNDLVNQEGIEISVKELTEKYS